MRPLLVLVGFGFGYFFCGLLALSRYSPCYQVAVTWRDLDATTDVLADKLVTTPGESPLSDDAIKSLFTYGMLLQKQGTAQAAACVGSVDETY